MQFVYTWILCRCCHLIATKEDPITYSRITDTGAEFVIVTACTHCGAGTAPETCLIVSLSSPVAVMQGATSLQMHLDPSHLVGPQL